MPHLFPGNTRRGSAACGMQDFGEQEVGGREGRREVREVRSLEKRGNILRGGRSGVISPWAKVLGIKEMDPFKARAG